jgi:hypothetical protein
VGCLSGKLFGRCLRFVDDVDDVWSVGDAVSVSPERLRRGGGCVDGCLVGDVMLAMFELVDAVGTVLAELLWRLGSFVDAVDAVSDAAWSAVLLLAMVRLFRRCAAPSTLWERCFAELF